MKRQWRDYRTAAGGRPVKAFLDKLTDEEAAAIVSGMKEVVEDVRLGLNVFAQTVLSVPRRF